MRNTKKAISILLTLLMVVGMMSTFAFAETAKATITIDNAVSGTTYKAYKIMDATFVANSNPVKGSYTIDENSQFYSAVNSKTDLFTLTKNTQGTWNVTPKSDITAKEIADWLKSVIEADGASFKAADTKTANTGSVTLEVEKDGFYYVSTDIGSVCTTFNTTTTVIHDKNTTTPTGGEKTVDNGKSTTSAQVGDIVPFELKVTATNYRVENGTSNKVNMYTIKDTMTGSMVLNALPEVTYTNFADDAVKPTAIFKKLSGETITSVSPTDALTGFIVEIDWSNVKDGKTHEIKVNYGALITGANETIKNKAEFKSDDTVIKETPDIPVYVYYFNLKKVDKDDNPLIGAKFKLYTEATSGTAIKFNVTGNKDDGFTYTVDSNGTTDEIDMSEVSNVKIIGLKNTTDNFKYYLEETVAPKGYNKLTERETVIISHLENGSAIAQTADQDVSIENLTGTELPSTGGIGTTIFYLIGAILVIGAGVVFVTRRRMHSDK